MSEQPSPYRPRALGSIVCSVVAWISSPVVNLLVRGGSAIFYGAFAILQFFLLALGLLWAVAALKGSRGAGDTVGVVLSVVGLLLSGGTLALVLVLIVLSVIVGR